MFKIWMFRLLGVGMAVFGLKSVVGSGMALLAGTSHYPLNEELITLTIFGALPLLLSSVFFFYSAKSEKDYFYKMAEKKIVHFAKSKDNKVSIFEISELLKCSLEKAKEVLEHLHTKGLARIEITAKGEFIYDFSHLYISEQDRQNTEKLDA